MLMKKRFLVLFFIVGCSLYSDAQTNPATLRNKSYKYFEEKITEHENDSTKLWFYLNAYLSKAKHDHNYEKAATAFEYMAFFSADESRITYADSTIYYAKKVKSNILLGKAYLTKGTILYSQKKYKKALDSYIIANDYINKTDDKYLKHEAKYSIANIKCYLGYYDEAATLFKDCADYFKDKEDSGYLSSMHSLSFCYNKLGKYDLCTTTNEIALKRAESIKDEISKSYIYHSEGINQYSKKNYTAAIEKINASLPLIVKENDFANETVGYFYIGKSYLALGDEEKAISYFKKVDKTFTDHEYIRPDLREGYEYLISYYKKNNNINIQLYYINKLIKADSLLNQNFRYLSDKIHKEYDTKVLLNAKSEIEEKLKNKESIATTLYCTITLLFFLVLYILYRHYKTQKAYRQKFEELMQQKETLPVQKDEDIKEIVKQEEDEELTKKPDINPEVIASILSNLEKFEAKQKFLQKDLTLINLASKFNTNSNYLSKTINYYKKKSYINYINDLRIDFIVQLLKDEPKFRNYTIKALAEESGFSTPQHFSKAFYAKTGIQPSYFVNEISKEAVKN